MFFAQVNLHFLNLGTHLEEFSIKWSRLRGDGLHMVSTVIPYNLGSFRDLPILVPPLEMGFDIFGGLVSHWFVAPFTAGGVEQNRLVDNVISKTEKLGSQWGITHLQLSHNNNGSPIWVTCKDGQAPPVHQPMRHVPSAPSQFR